MEEKKEYVAVHFVNLSPDGPRKKGRKTLVDNSTKRRRIFGGLQTQQ